MSTATRRATWALILCVLFLAAATALGGCGGEGPGEVLQIGGIPDQEAAKLARRFNTVADYLRDELDVQVEYVPSVDYAALVTAFKNGDVHLGWFGGLTGVQARDASPGARAIAQRPRDTEFHSVFVAGSDLEVTSLEDLKGLTFTFGSESSTSGHLMPRHFLLQAGVDADADFQGLPGYSGSHDKTWKLVESGSFQAGALNEAVWQKAVDDGKVDLGKVRVFFTTPPYFDYNWSVRGDLDQAFGEGFTQRIQSALMSLSPSQEGEKEILDLFQAQGFVPSDNGNYEAIEDVARDLGIIR
ncbi:MAG: putative selenate ABC transporter substrate-binding protein [Dehalococcoidia bacterium]|nr:putative selenate ABC transporter substrate-binding protein [Dehalococcoidia bacterium]